MNNKNNIGEPTLEEFFPETPDAHYTEPTEGVKVSEIDLSKCYEEPQIPPKIIDPNEEVEISMKIPYLEEGLKNGQIAGYRVFLKGNELFVKFQPVKAIETIKCEFMIK